MKAELPNLQLDPLEAFNAWLDTERGQYLFAWEQQKLEAIVADVFGFCALQIGLVQRNLLNSCRIRESYSCAQHLGADVLSRLEHLPFAAQSVDLVVLPHVLEFCAHPHQVLREVERILVPEGHIVIAGFNPLSLWGLRRIFSGHVGKMPWRGQYLSVPRLKDWLTLLGLETHLGAFGCYAPPCATEKWLNRWGFMDAAGDRWWPFAGGAYVIQAIKRVHGMRLVGARWRERRKRARTLVPAAEPIGKNIRCMNNDD